MKKTFVKLLSSILFLTLFANMFVSVTALTENVCNDIMANDSTVNVRLSEYTIDDMPLSMREAIIPDGSTNKTVSTINADDMYSVTIDNGDGTQTVNIFQNPIKYKSENGEIKFYTHALESIAASTLALTSDALYSYKNEEGAVKTYYSSNIQSGVKLSYNNYNVTMAPLTDATHFPDIAELMSSDNQTLGISDVAVSNSQISTNTAKVTFSCDGNKIMYNNVLANGITYEYMPIANGIKENIILNSYNNINTFHFIINIGNLQPDKLSADGEGIRLTDPTNPDADAIIISPIYAYDSAGKMSFDHSMHLTESDTDGEYILTVVADREFLESPTTVYPVTIDPTIYPETTNYVADTFVSSYHNDRTYSSAGFFPVGNDSYYDQSEAFLQIKDISRYSFICPNNITSATLTLDCYYTTGISDNPVEIYAYSNSSNVNINTLTWNNRPKIVGNPYGAASGGTIKVSSTSLYTLTITELVQDWFKYAYNEGGQSHLRSLRLKMVNSEDDPHYATFRSTEYGTIYPYFSITYTPCTELSTSVVQVINLYSGKNLGAEQSNNFGVVQYTVENSQNQWWILRHLGNGVYKFENKSPFYQTQGRKFLSVSEVNSTVDLYNESDTLLTQRFYIIPCYERNGEKNGYRIVPVYNADQPGGNKAIGNSGSLSNGSSISYYTYNGNSDAQKWQFYEAYFSVNNYYDNGALTRWDLTYSQIQSEDEGIGYYTNIAEKLYLDQFGIYINHNTPELLTSYADECTGYETIDQLNNTICNHNSYEHKSEHSFWLNLDNLSISTSPRTIPVLWTGHDSSDIEDRMAGLTRNREQVLMLYIDNQNDFSPNAQRLETYLHELAHCFGAYDSYCKNDNGNSPCSNTRCYYHYPSAGYKQDCLMAECPDNVLRNIKSGIYRNIFCSKCQEDIEKYLETLY